MLEDKPFLQVVAVAAEGDRHSDDVECAVFHEGVLYTGSDDGLIKVSTLIAPVSDYLKQSHHYNLHHHHHHQAWTSDLELLCSWSGHEFVVYDLAVDPGLKETFLLSFYSLFFREPCSLLLFHGWGDQEVVDR